MPDNKREVVTVTFDAEATERRKNGYVEPLICDVCGNEEAIGVASSTLGAVSFAYGKRCLSEHAEPYGMLVATVAMCGGRGEVAKWVHPIIDGTMKVLGKTFDEFDADVATETERMMSDPYFGGGDES